MAESTNTPNHRPMALTAGDIGSLADRLAARGASLIFQGSPEVARDTATASRTIRRLVKMLESINMISNVESVQLID